MREYSKIGGILTIVSGGVGILIGLMIGLLIILFGVVFQNQSGFEDMPSEMLIMLAVIYGLMALFMVLLGVLGIVGGLPALKKKRWGLALAGATAETMSFYVCGIVALIFVVMAKNEYIGPIPAVNPLAPAQTLQSPSV